MRLFLLLLLGLSLIPLNACVRQRDGDASEVEVLRSGALTGLLMSIIYIATILMGAQSRGLFETSENGGIALAQIANHYLGGAGKIVLAVTITFACLKTSIGLVTSCADAFSRMFPKFISYRAWAIVFSVFSFCVSNIGLSRIIGFSLPVLMFLYPLAITLILLALCGRLFTYDRAVFVSVTAFTVFAAIFDLLKALPSAMQNLSMVQTAIAFAEKSLPWFELNLGWVVPAIIGFLLGMLIRAIRNRKLQS